MVNETTSPKPIETKEPTPSPWSELQTLILNAAEHDFFEECFAIPGFARPKKLAELATDFAGEPIAAVDLLAGGALDTRPEGQEKGFSERLFEAIYVRHQMPWNGGPVR